MMQINLTGFLGGGKARVFIGELWTLLANAQTAPDGIPAELVEMKKKQLLKAQVVILEVIERTNIDFHVLGRSRSVT